MGSPSTNFPDIQFIVKLYSHFLVQPFHHDWVTSSPISVSSECSRGWETSYSCSTDMTWGRVRILKTTLSFLSCRVRKELALSAWLVVPFMLWFHVDDTFVCVGSVVPRPLREDARFADNVCDNMCILPWKLLLMMEIENGTRMLQAANRSSNRESFVATRCYYFLRYSTPTARRQMRENCWHWYQ